MELLEEQYLSVLIVLLEEQSLSALIVLLEEQYLSALIVLISQIIFIYLRTINVIYTAELKLWPAIFSGSGIGLAWLVSISIGSKAMMNGEILPIITFLIGGALGTYIGLTREIKKRNG